MRMTHDEMIAVIQADKDGIAVQSRWIGDSDDSWIHGKTGRFIWDFSEYEYRIKPEPRSLWVVRFQSGNIASCHESRLEAMFRFSIIKNATIEEYKEVSHE